MNTTDDSFNYLETIDAAMISLFRQLAADVADLRNEVNELRREIVAIKDNSRS